MSIDKFFVRSATIVHPLPVAGYGDAQSYDYAQGSTVNAKCWLHQLSASELQGPSREAQQSTHVATFPEGTSILSRDRIVIDGQAFDVDGPPSDVWTPSGPHHVKVNLIFADG